MAKKDFLALSDLDKPTMEGLLRRGMEVKKEWKEGRGKKPFAGKVLGLLFHKPSLRTRVSFDVGMAQLGGHSIYLTDQEIGMGTREAIQDVGQVLARFMDVLMIRTFAHENAVKLARHAPIPVINGLTDLLHPCQVMADLMTVLEHRGSLDDMVVTWLGDGNNVAHSWINAAGILPLELRIAAPQGYEPDESIVSAARKRGAGRIEVTHDPAAAAEGADVLCTDAWASMGQEKEHQERARVMKPFQLNASLLARSKKESLVLHCLPAHRGEEITDEVMDGPNSVVYDEAENRLHAQKAILEWLLS